jgi:hypothetical protein
LYFGTNEKRSLGINGITEVDTLDLKKKAKRLLGGIQTNSDNRHGTASCSANHSIEQGCGWVWAGWSHVVATL